MLMLPDVDRVQEAMQRGRVSDTSPEVTQADNPGEDIQHIGGVKLPELPDPAVGGRNGSRDRNGFSTGFRSLAQRFQPFLGAMAKPPAITNSVQGEVGMNNRQSRLYAGVLNQLTQYRASSGVEYLNFVTDNVTVARGR